MKVVANCGAGAGQEVMHTHFHVLPVSSSISDLKGRDVLAAPEGGFAMIDPEKAKAFMAALKKFL